MRLAVLSESSADEAAVRVIVGGILGREIRHISIESSLRVRGWPGVKTLLPVIIPRLYYNSDAEALALVVDSDSSTIHQPSHNDATEVGNCRLCDLCNSAEYQLSRLTPVPGKGMLKIAIGLAVPAIEAWYVCLRDTHVNEATWARHLGGEQITYTKNSLKEKIYGTERPSIALETECAVRVANELINDLDRIEELFPNGFSFFARGVRGWI
ncbi:MAG TPA: hypothetical protein VGC87_26195 [Pyrinomonadaceae bacterium]|jgi:hypothetical protein